MITKNIFQRIHAVMTDVTSVVKKGYNSHQKYFYAREADYIESIRPALLKHGLVINISMSESKKETIVFGEKGEKIQHLTTVKLCFRIVNIDKPDEAVEQFFEGQGVDNSDKGMNKAITAAKKYFLSTNFLMETNDDAEADQNDFDQSKNKKPIAQTSGAKW